MPANPVTAPRPKHDRTPTWAKAGVAGSAVEITRHSGTSRATTSADEPGMSDAFVLDTDQRTAATAGPISD